MHIYRTYQSMILYIFCKLFNVKFVIDAHGAVPYHTNKIRLKKLFDMFIGRRMLRDAHKLIAETEVGKQEYLDIYPDLPHEKIEILSPLLIQMNLNRSQSQITFAINLELERTKK